MFVAVMAFVMMMTAMAVTMFMLMVMTAIAVVMVVMVAAGVRVVSQRPLRKRLCRIVCVSLHAGVEFDSDVSQRHLRAHADARRPWPPEGIPPALRGRSRWYQ